MPDAMRRLGLIGGTSWESTAHYYTALNVGVRERLGGLHSADLVLASADFAPVAALQERDDWEELGRRYAAAAVALRDSGAEVLGILANTMHLVADAASEASGLPVVHVVDAVGDRLAALGVRQAGLLGTAYTMQASQLYPARLAPRGIEVLIPPADDRAEVHRVVYEELCQGLVLDSSRKTYLRIVDDLAAAGAEAVILGCTEHAMLLADGDAGVPLLDSTQIHVDALLDACPPPPPRKARHESPHAVRARRGPAGRARPDRLAVQPTELQHPLAGGGTDRGRGRLAHDDRRRRRGLAARAGHQAAQQAHQRHQDRGARPLGLRAARAAAGQGALRTRRPARSSSASRRCSAPTSST